jgi:hypothetical protein
MHLYQTIECHIAEHNILHSHWCENLSLTYSIIVHLRLWKERTHTPLTNLTISHSSVSNPNLTTSHYNYNTYKNGQIRKCYTLPCFEWSIFTFVWILHITWWLVRIHPCWDIITKKVGAMSQLSSARKAEKRWHYNSLDSWVVGYSSTSNMCTEAEESPLLRAVTK